MVREKRESKSGRQDNWRLEFKQGQILLEPDAGPRPDRQIPGESPRRDFWRSRHQLTLPEYDDAYVLNAFFTTATMFSAPLRRQLASTARASSRRASSSAASSASSSSSSAWRNARLVAGAAVLAGTSYCVGAVYPPELAHLLSPRSAPGPLHPDDPAALTHIADLEEELHRLPVLLDHRKATDGDEWYETRPYLNLPEERRVNSLTAGTLKGPGKLAIPPLVRARHDAKENWMFIHVGRALCGHEGVIHGGLLATLLDESLARVVSLLSDTLRGL